MNGRFMSLATLTRGQIQVKRSTRRQRANLDRARKDFTLGNMRLVQCQAAHLEGIRGILNEAILHSTASYDYAERSLETMRGWYEVKEKGGFPLIGFETDKGELAGFGSYGSFRALPGYRFTVEHSVYVKSNFRGQGLGKQLLGRLIQLAREQNYHVMLGVIDSANEVSIRLHHQLGFEPAGTLRQVGFKFDRWLDVVFYQLILNPAPGSDSPSSK